MSTTQSVEDAKQTSNLAGNSDKHVGQSKEPHLLESTMRTIAIHPSITEVKLPSKDANVAYDLHPVTLQPFTVDELRTHNIESLMRQYPTQEAAQKEIEIAVKELRTMLDENSRKTQQIEHEMKEKEKTMEIERKAYYSNYNKKSKDG